MDPSYQQLMVQQLMGAGSMPQGMGGQNASTPYGAAFMTGNAFAPQGMGASPQTTQSSNPSMGMLNQSASQVLQQPLASY